MMLTTLFVALLAVAHDATLTSADVAAAHTAVKVMSFNLRTSNAKDPCPGGCWEQRQHRVRKMLSQYAPDFIGTQEGAPDQIAFVENSCGYASFGECAGPCDGNERNSIFYVKDRWQLLQGSTFALSDTPDTVPSNTWNLEYLRAGVLARFEHRATKNTVCMLNTHYDITRGQEKSSILVMERLAAFCQPTDTVVLTGDLNATPGVPAIQYLSGSTQLQGKSSPMPLYETLTAAGASGATWIGDSFGTHPAGSKIDYIFARRDSQTCLRAAKIIADAYDGFSCSDHAVLQSEFLIGAGCARCPA